MKVFICWFARAVLLALYYGVCYAAMAKDASLEYYGSPESFVVAAFFAAFLGLLIAAFIWLIMKASGADLIE